MVVCLWVQGEGSSVTESNVCVTRKNRTVHRRPANVTDINAVEVELRQLMTDLVAAGSTRTPINRASSLPNIQRGSNN